MAYTYGYVRVSNREQHEDRQLISLMDKGVLKRNIYVDKQSGKDFERPKYQELVRGKLRQGDLLMVKSIDRLGRNYTDIIEQWKLITREIGADIIILDMPLLDTTQNKDLLGTFISDLVLQILSFIAENERDNIRQRQAEGILAARRRGVQFGRPQTQVTQEFLLIYTRWQEGTLSSREAQELSGYGPDKFYRMARRCREMDF